MKRVLVIGAAGTVGRAVISQLLSSNVHISAFTRNPASANLSAEVELFQGGLGSPASLDPALADFRPRSR